MTPNDLKIKVRCLRMLDDSDRRAMDEICSEIDHFARRLNESERLAELRLSHATEDFRRCCELAIKCDMLTNDVKRLQKRWDEAMRTLDEAHAALEDIRKSACKATGRTP